MCSKMWASFGRIGCFMFDDPNIATTTLNELFFSGDSRAFVDTLLESLVSGLFRRALCLRLAELILVRTWPNKVQDAVKVHPKSKLWQLHGAIDMSLSNRTNKTLILHTLEDGKKRTLEPACLRKRFLQITAKRSFCTLVAHFYFLVLNAPLHSNAQYKIII